MRKEYALLFSYFYLFIFFYTRKVSHASQSVRLSCLVVRALLIVTFDLSRGGEILEREMHYDNE